MIRINHLSVSYRGAEKSSLCDINLDIKPGQLILLSGPTGSGKSTLINCLNGILLYESSAVIDGDILFGNVNLKDVSLTDICRLTGTVFQNPNAQICTSTVETEIAFGLENSQTDRATMRERIDHALKLTKLEHCRHQSTSTLSGGQKQRLMIACVLATKPKLLLLDEPLSQLDPKGTKEIVEVINTLKAKGDIAVILVEHRIEDTLYLSDRVVIMDQGRIVLNKTRESVVHHLDCMRRLGLSIPHLPDLFDRLGFPERPLLPETAPLVKIRSNNSKTLERGRGSCLCELKEVSFRYQKQSTSILDNVSVRFCKGDCIALMGSNGAGKSTLLQLIAGQIQPTAGAICWLSQPAPKIGLLLQSPDLMLFCDSVKEEIEFAPKHQKKSKKEVAAITKQVLTQMELEDLLQQAPFSLSGGQRLRTAMASILSVQPDVLLLDEPTSGQDRRQIEKMMTSINSQFDLVIFCTHCIETAVTYSNHVMLMEGGKISAFGAPEEVFFTDSVVSTSALVQPVIQRYAKRLGIQALTVDQVLEHCA